MAYSGLPLNSVIKFLRLTFYEPLVTPCQESTPTCSILPIKVLRFGLCVRSSFKGLYSTGRQLLRAQPRSVRYIIFRLQASYPSATSYTGRQPCRVKSLYMKRFCVRPCGMKNVKDVAPPRSNTDQKDLNEKEIAHGLTSPGPVYCTPPPPQMKAIVVVFLSTLRNNC